MGHPVARDVPMGDESRHAKRAERLEAAGLDP
jgi:hypothetical protein